MFLQIVKFVFLIPLDLAGQFVDYVGFDGCDVAVVHSMESIESWSHLTPASIKKNQMFKEGVHFKSSESLLGINPLLTMWTF